jgi:hemerythrin-like metal-binding protein
MEHRKSARETTTDPVTGDIEPFPWLPVLEMGNEEIDRDHREAVEEGNRILRLLNARDSWAETLELLRRTRDRSTRHFANEDKILKRAGYPGADAHRRAHRRILVELNAIIAELEIVTDPQPHHWERAHAPRNLLVDHCLHDDLKFKSHLEHVGQARRGPGRVGPNRK